MSCEYEESVDSCGGGTSEEWPSHEVLVFKMLLTPTYEYSINQTILPFLPFILNEYSRF
jgi:hypothetical protein